MRLNELLFTPRPSSYFNRSPWTLKELFTQKVLRIALEIIVVLCATHFFFCSLKLTVNVLTPVSCSVILLHIIVDCLLKGKESSLGRILNVPPAATKEGKKERGEKSDFFENFELNSTSSNDSPVIPSSTTQSISKEPLFDGKEEKEKFHLAPRCLCPDFDEVADEKTNE